MSLHVCVALDVLVTAWVNGGDLSTLPARAWHLPIVMR